MDVLEEITADVEDLFPPRPGGMVDTARKQRAAQQPDPLETSGPAQRTARPVPVKTRQPDMWGAKTLTVAAGTSAQAMPADPNRKRGVLSVLSGTPGSSSTAEGSVTDPAASTAIAFTNTLPAGAYEVTCTVFLSGTVTAADGTNMELVADGALVSKILYPGVAGIVVTYSAQVTLAAAGTIGIQTVANASGAAAVYNASVTATPLSTSGQVLVARDRSSADSGTGFILGSGLPLEIEHTREVWVNNPGGSAVQVSVLTESYAD